MPSGLVVHIQDRERQRTEVLMQDRIRVGTRAQHELRVALPVSISRSGTLIELARTNGHYAVARFADHPGLTINGQPPVAGDVIEDGDELRFSDGTDDTDNISSDDSTADVSLQFFTVNNKLPLVARGNVTNIRQAANRALVPKVERETQVQPFIEQAALESSETTRRDDAKVFLREFTRELVREISPVTKLIALALTVSLVGGLLYFGFAAYREIRNTRRENEELTAKLAGLEKQLDTTGTQIRESGQSYKQLLDSMSLAPTLVASYSDGVCLIGGTYDFVDPATNKPLRYNEGLVSEDGATEDVGNQAATTGGESTGSGASQGLTTEGAGAIAEFDFIGTGFHVGDGFILTNRHVVQPWESDERAQFLSGNVAGRPRLKRLFAFFPNQKQQFALRIRRLSSDANVDLAACAIDLKQATGTIPVLPLDNGTDAVGRGKEVLMMGYPTGEDLILARSPEAASGIGQRAGASMEVRLRYLAEQNRIKPSVPRGHITDLEAFRIVHNASNAAGGSGAPLFGQSGRVIGINFGVFAEINNASFAIPIRYGISLLQRAGWKDANDSLTADNSNSNTSNANNSNAPKTATNERR